MNDDDSSVYSEQDWFQNLSADMRVRGLTEDHFLGGTLSLYQPKIGYRAAMDPVLLAAAAPALSRKKVLDLGSGIGTAGFCYLKRCPNNHLVAIEKQEDLAKLALVNAHQNDLASGVRILNEDIQQRFLEGYESNSFDLVITNPPYMETHKTIASVDHIRQKANVEDILTLQQWIDIGLKKLKQKGHFVIIQRADRLDEIVSALNGKVGEMTVIPLWPKAGEAARRVIIRGRKAVKGGAIMHPGLVLHENGQRYSQLAEEILRFGTSLD